MKIALFSKMYGNEPAGDLIIPLPMVQPFVISTSWDSTPELPLTQIEIGHMSYTVAGRPQDVLKQLNIE